MAEENPPDNTNPDTQDNSHAGVIPSPPHPPSSDNTDNDILDQSNSLKAIGASNLKDVDHFIQDLWAIEDKTCALPDVPDIIHFFSRDMESRVQMYISGDVSRRFGKCDEEDSDFMDSVRRMSKLIAAVGEFHNIDWLLNQTTFALHRAVVLLEDEFRTLLDDSRNNPEPPPPPPLESTPSFYKFSSFNLKNTQPDIVADRCSLPRDADSGDYPGYSPETAVKLGEIAGTMIAAGYEVECSQIYYLSRRNAIRNHMTKLECDIVLSMDDVAKMAWQSLEAEITRWIDAVKTFSDVIFPGERNLGESVFSESLETHQRILSSLVRIVLIQLLDFAEATALAKRSAEKLFKYLDMYETLKALILSIRDDESFSEDLIADVSVAAERVGGSVVSIFCYLEESIRGDAARTPVPGGAVHPLTRYVMNYLKYACEYINTLEEIFHKHSDLTIPVQANTNLPTQELEKETESPRNSETLTTASSPFSIQLVTVMDVLDSNLSRKSDLYKDPALHYIFLMNNGRYILQKVKGSPEIRHVMGDNWCRRRSTVVRNYHKNYQRETWNKVVQCLSHEGIVGNGGKVNKALLKERVKTFTAMFEEIHRTQSGWAVSDEQLQSELRISISGVVIPAYRSFVGRFRQHLEPGGKQVGKYIKYQPEDIEGLIEGLFEGNMNASLSRRR